MKKLIKLFSVLLAIFALSFFITSYAKAGYEPKYIMSNYNGKVAVYKYKEETPQSIFDVYVSSFPSNEQKNIKSGINIYSENELQDILEAYLS